MDRKHVVCVCVCNDNNKILKPNRKNEPEKKHCEHSSALYIQAYVYIYLFRKKKHNKQTITEIAWVNGKVGSHEDESKRGELYPVYSLYVHINKVLERK